MIRVNNIASLPEIKGPICLAIGTFDGVHLGHTKLIRKMKSLGKAVIFTFSNHPTDILQGNKTIPSLTTIDHKEKLLAEAGVDYCVIQPFSHDIAQMPYNLFLEEIYTCLPFSHLFFGEGDVIGKNREGTPKKIAEIANVLNFEVHYIPKEILSNTIISSTEVRKALRDGNLELAKNLLGQSFRTEVLTSDPYLDNDLLKEGKYCIELLSKPNMEFDIAVDKEGNIAFNKTLPHFQDNETEIIIFKRKK